MDWIDQRVEEGKALVKRLLLGRKLAFDSSLRQGLPEQPGLYAIYRMDARSGEALRAGRTKTAVGGLRQRVYQNHIMGSQPGNLRAQLVKDGTCSDSDEAKAWMKQNCVVQFVIVEDDELRRWGEHFMLSILRPKYSD